MRPIDPFIWDLLSGCANRKTGVVDVVAGEQAPGDARILVGKRDGNDVRVSPLGFDAQTEQYVDMLNAGIVDPAKVVRVALQDAASVAGLMITTEAMVAETPKKKESPAMPGGGGMGGMDY